MDTLLSKWYSYVESEDIPNDKTVLSMTCYTIMTTNWKADFPTKRGKIMAVI